MVLLGYETKLNIKLISDCPVQYHNCIYRITGKIAASNFAILRLNKHFAVFHDLHAGVMCLYCDLTNSWDKLS